MQPTILLIVAVSLAMSLNLSAGDFTLYGGIHNPGKLNFRDAQASPVSNSSGSVFGARVSGGQLLGLEWSAGISPRFLESSQKAFNTQANLVVSFPVQKTVPYATFGAGLITTRGAETELRDIGLRFNINYGGGLKIPNLAGPLGVRVDVRGYTVPRVSVGPLNLQTRLNFLESTVGLLFSW